LSLISWLREATKRLILWSCVDVFIRVLVYGYSMYEQVLENIIVRNWNQKIVYKKRNILPNSDLDSNISFCFIGPRRSGKSYYLYELKEYLISKGHKKEEFIHINFEDVSLIGFSPENFEEILATYSKLSNNKPIFLLDEIQNVDYWYKYIRNLIDNQYRVFITGSNSELLSSEIATYLGARANPVCVYPLSFREYLDFLNIEYKSKAKQLENKSKINSVFNEFLEFGGFPEIVGLTDYRKKEILLNYFELMLGDVSKRWNINKEDNLKLLIQKIRENIGNEFSVKSLKRALVFLGNPIGEKQIYAYLDYLERAFMIKSISPYNKSIRKKLFKKSYIIDNGYISLFDVLEDKGLKLENLVYTEMIKIGYEVFYYKDKGECDFILRKDQALIPVQVSYEINSNNYDREINGLITSMELLNTSKGVIITNNISEKKIVSGKEIKLVSFVDWALNDYNFN